MKSFVNYALEGYDPGDGLDETCGRWMRDTWGVVRWVQTSAPRPKPQTTGPRKVCVDCSTPVDKRALRCRPHAKNEADRIKREHMRKVRSEGAAA